MVRIFNIFFHFIIEGWKVYMEQSATWMHHEMRTCRYQLLSVPFCFWPHATRAPTCTLRKVCRLRGKVHLVANGAGNVTSGWLAISSCYPGRLGREGAIQLRLSRFSG